MYTLFWWTSSGHLELLIISSLNLSFLCEEQKSRIWTLRVGQVSKNGWSNWPGSNCTPGKVEDIRGPQEVQLNLDRCWHWWQLHQERGVAFTEDLQGKSVYLSFPFFQKPILTVVQICALRQEASTQARGYGKVQQHARDSPELREDL